MPFLVQNLPNSTGVNHVVLDPDPTRFGERIAKAVGGSIGGMVLISGISEDQAAIDAETAVAPEDRRLVALSAALDWLRQNVTSDIRQR